MLFLIPVTLEVSLTVLTILLTSSALAQATPAADASVSANERVVYAEETEYTEADFTGLTLEGQLIRPSGVVSMIAARPGFHPLFQLRRDFDVEIAESPGALSIPPGS